MTARDPPRKFDMSCWLARTVFSPQSFSAYGKAEGDVKEKKGKKGKGQGTQPKKKRHVKRKADCFSNLFSSQDSEVSFDDDDDDVRSCPLEARF